MSDITEGLGSAVEGALTARAVEPDKGDTRSLRDGVCLNCGTALTGAFCRDCGQRAHVHRSLKAIGHDLLHGVLHLDGKLWRTLPLLMAKPGDLTRRYIDGERAKFVSPMAMFLFSVFLMFAVFQMVGLSTPATLNPQDAVPAAAETLQSVADQERKALVAELEGLPEGDARIANIERQIEKIDSELEELDAAKDIDISERIDTDGISTGVKWIDDGIIAKWRENPGLMLYKLQTNAYKFSWLLIPLSIPFVWVMFAWRRQFKAYDHAIFVTYSLSFMTLMFILLSLLVKAGMPGGWAFFLAVLIAPLHIYKQLKNSYALSRFSTIWRCIFLIWAINMIITLFLQALFLLGAF